MAKSVITIDGPAASGKSTAARLLAEKLGAIFLDTGAMYRAVTLAAINADVNMEDTQQLLAVLEKTKFDFVAELDHMLVSINEADVTEKIRSPEVTANAHYIASTPALREKLVRMQRQFAAKYDKIVTEGRDQGTVAFPDADVKFYLVAGVDERARRRQAELVAKGIETHLEQIKQAIEKRDASDRNRTVGPLTAADDAVIVDTTALSIDEVMDKLLGIVKEKCSQND